MGIVAVNWLDQYTDTITWSESPARVINDLIPPIPRIRDVQAESIDGDGSIRLTWTPTTMARFTDYFIYGQSHSFNRIEDAVRIATIDDRTQSEYIVDNIAGISISQQFLYSFAVLVRDHNDIWTGGWTTTIPYME